MDYEDDQMCFVCGTQNGDGLHLDFELIGVDRIRTEFTPSKKFQGWKDVLHGGLIATILDEVMVNGAYLRQIMAVTTKLEIRLRRPAAIGERLIFYGQILKKNTRTVNMKAWAEREDGTIVAEATGLLMMMKVRG
ncbi:PaaI family thioesterase [Candidatus Methylomirabilis sp.]|uniref:PaaI family thioesterase n=1 Tax=Candidatus Methylomirabilis sp. TaxID=2032687 RepID=UPI00307661CF